MQCFENSIYHDVGPGNEEPLIHADKLNSVCINMNVPMPSRPLKKLPPVYDNTA
jgi:hypothetical protein